MIIPYTDDCTPFMPVDRKKLEGNSPVIAGNTIRCRVCNGDHLVVSYLDRSRIEPPNAVDGVPSELLFHYCKSKDVWVLVGLYGRRMKG